ncbi:hypothetical protein [Streptomyces sp. NRRL_B-2557]|uniref:hypothetical protein n=1 Tax=Streptomyces sp. NRRL_B-2557 TaxID=3028698 RepID=UPI0029ADE151|nr:hypothetical protein [Streptomyces sp. NRRL_B-2557]MDX2748296.1 hypothetical protein [Streptomyces sp. NRRL_B-2557]
MPLRADATPAASGCARPGTDGEDRPRRGGHQCLQRLLEVRDVLAPVRQLLTQVVGLGLGELATVLGRSVLLPYPVRFGLQSGSGPVPGCRP